MKHRRLLVLLIVLAALAGVVVLRQRLTRPPGPGAGPADAARRLAQEGNDPGAVDQWKQAIMAEPANGDYYGELGNAYLNLRRYDQAASVLEMAAYFQPERPHVFCQLAQALVEEYRRDDALKALKTALEKTPDCPLALSVKGEQLLRDDNLTDALAAFQRVIQVAPDFPLAYQKAGYILLSTHRLDEARPILERGLTLSPSDPGVHALLGELFAQQSGPALQELAEQHFKLALEKNPEAAKAHAALGKLCLRKGDLPQAREHYSAALVLQPSLEEALYGMAQVSRREGKQEDAARYLREMEAGQKVARAVGELQARAAARPDDVDLRLRIARLCMDNLLVKEARRALDEAVRLDPGRKEARELRARWFLNSGLPERARREFAVAELLPRK